MIHTENGMFLSHKRMPSARTWIDLETAILSELRQTQISHDIAYMWNLKKMIQMNLFNRTESWD